MVYILLGVSDMPGLVSRCRFSSACVVHSKIAVGFWSALVAASQPAPQVALSRDLRAHVQNERFQTPGRGGVLERPLPRL